MVSVEYIKKIKEFLKDPKKKSLTQLGIYIVFFIFVFILLNSSDGIENNEIIEEQVKLPLDIYEDMKGYTYKVVYTNVDKIDIIEGTYYNDKSLFNYNNLKYYYEDSLYVINDYSYTNTVIEYDISKIFSNNFINIINKLEEVSETKYKDGKIEKSYTISSSEIYKYLYDAENIYEGLVNVNITEYDNQIQKIMIDLSSLNINLFKIEIEYSNIDNIEDLEFNKDNYVYEESIW